ncbi:hypothetical protein [Haloechinothrix halophila]|uniref:hypothetical protein n=1 Tax=Haloechinothrix halophila TaxID=1069073 RepID=UPI000686EF6B|nr:hypothetical protein [Haloechinothrix halophila]
MRAIVGYAAAVSALPYLGLKLLWLSGSDAGITDPAFAEDGGIYALNLLTAGMDVVAIVLAVTFASRRGMRAPAPLVLFPIWVGTGFLAPIVVATPLAATTSGDSAGASTLPLAGWVIPLVYGSFVGLGVLLLTAFLLYARERWSGRLTTVPRGPVAALLGSALALFVAVVHGVWIIREDGGDVVWAVHGAFALIGVVGVWWLRRGVRWLPLMAAWAGSGALFAWGAWNSLNTLGGTVLVMGEPSTLGVARALAQVLGGTVLAYASARVVTVSPSSVARDRPGARECS